MTIVKVNGRDWQSGIPGGCSSPNGHYVGKNVVWTAIGAGWTDGDARQAAEEYDDASYDENWRYFDAWWDIVTEAEQYLNSVTEGGFWMWTDGDFRLVATTECETCGETIDADAEGVCPEHSSWEDYA